MDITVRVEVQYVAPERALVRDVLHMFRTPAWVRFMVRYISPHLKNAAPADKSVVDALAGWRIRSDGSSDSGSARRHSDSSESDACSSDACVICMSDVSSATSAAATVEQQQEQESGAVQLPCGHCFHHGCIQSWLKLRSTCPSCRFQFRKAFSGSYAVKTLNSALLLKPEHRFLAKEVILDSCVGMETVRAVVNVTLSQIASQQTKRSQYPCVLNALMMHSNGDSFTEAPSSVDKAVESAAASAAARTRAMAAGSAASSASTSAAVAAMASPASSGLVRTADEMCAASSSSGSYELESERRSKRVRVH